MELIKTVHIKIKFWLGGKFKILQFGWYGFKRHFMHDFIVF